MDSQKSARQPKALFLGDDKKFTALDCQILPTELDGVAGLIVVVDEVHEGISLLLYNGDFYYPARFLSVFQGFKSHVYLPIIKNDENIAALEQALTS